MDEKMDILEMISMADKLTAQGQEDKAIKLYREWIEKNSDAPLVYAACFNLGVSLGKAGDLLGAEKAYRQSIAFKPDFIQGRFNLGSTLENEGRFNEALDEWRKILAIRAYAPDDPAILAEKELYIMTFNNLGRLLEIVKEYKEAELMLEQSLILKPQQPDAISHWVHLRQKQCEWPVYKNLSGLSKEYLMRASSAIATLSASNEPQHQLDIALDFVKSKVNTDSQITLANSSGYNHEKLKIGYVSSDFRTHAVSLLTVEMFELHDRSKFEIYAFCSTPNDYSPLRRRVLKAMDHVIKIADMSDEEAARAIRSHEIDILVDLQGLTSGLRPNIFAFRPAPVQITYLGFPGTTALPGIDYVLADKFLIPDELTPFFTEKPLYMPNVFQVSDRQREVGVKPDRATYNLPNNAFVLCSFNNNYKITEKIFSCWMRILKRTKSSKKSPKSVLWLLADNKWAQENMVKAALKHGVSKDRLIFASRVAPPDYLAR
ncbi:MAG: tetratricopeptide repeat protein [Desulfamplus sp.]|nr:tetratricopeptide repeat protein [Desulfamplus sp.]